MSRLTQEFLKQLTTEATKVKLSEEEHRTLTMALEGSSIKEIAEKEGITEVAIQKRLGKIYKKFNITSTGPGKLMELKYQLESKYQSQTEAKQELKTQLKHYHLEEAPQPTNFYGRETELTQLEQWIIEDNCQLLAVLGKGGIGKTALSVQLIERIKNNFDYVIWRSLSYGPEFTKTFTTLINILSGKSTTHLEAENQMISTLIEYLRNHRCLIVLDNLEEILQSNEFVGHYQDQYKGYGRLFRRLGEEKHQSCILITSREKPREIAFLEEIQPVRSLLLEGLKQDAEKILQAKKLSGEDKWIPLIKLYKGNPLGLKLIATTIQQLYGGDVSKFLEQTLTFVVRGFGEIIEEQFKRLTLIEKEIVYWLALEPILSIEKLREKFISPPPQIDIINGLESLIGRDMIEREESGFTLQPTVRESVLNLFIEQISREIKNFQTMADIQFMRSHKFSDTNNDKKKEYQSPVKLIEKKLYSLEYFRSPEQVIERLQEMQKIIEEKPEAEKGYADENVRELLEEFQQK